MKSFNSRKNSVMKIFLHTFLAAGIFCGALTGGNLVMAKENAVPSRADAASAVTEKLYGDKNLQLVKNDNELNAVMNKFVYADTHNQVQLDRAQCEILTLVALTAASTPKDIPLHVRGALKAGATPAQVREAVFHCTPYVGMGRVQTALELVYGAFKSCGVKLPLENAGTTDDSNRFAAGLAVQKAIFGEAIDKMYATAPQDQRFINEALSANCFGDYYTRGVLDVKERELVTFTALAALGGCDAQARAHAKANIDVGNTRQDLLDALAIALPYIGYPRTLNALAAINAVAPAK